MRIIIKSLEETGGTLYAGVPETMQGSSPYRGGIQVKGAGPFAGSNGARLKIRLAGEILWRRPSWVRIPPPAPPRHSRSSRIGKVRISVSLGKPRDLEIRVPKC